MRSLVRKHLHFLSNVIQWKGDKMKRKLEQLNLLDDFLFGNVLSYPEIGERLLKAKAGDCFDDHALRSV